MIECLMNSKISRPRLVIILGPTGVGKTDIAVKLACQCGGEIISADSMQVYRYMDVGTAKPTFKERSLVKHHLIDIVNPDEEFNAAMFMKKAASIIEKLKNERKNIFIVGGTGLYIRALLGGLFDESGNETGARNDYRKTLNDLGRKDLYNILREKDKNAAAIIHPNNAIRIIRALEVLEFTGESIVKKQEEHRFKKRDYDYIKIGLYLERSLLYERIEKRAEAMIVSGLVEETEKLLEMGYNESHKPIQSLGYKYIVNYIRKQYNSSEALRLLKRDTKRYAKRQLTWLRADKEIKWFNPEDEGSIRKTIENFLHDSVDNCLRNTSYM